MVGTKRIGYRLKKKEELYLYQLFFRNGKIRITKLDCIPYRHSLYVRIDGGNGKYDISIHPYEVSLTNGCSMYAFDNDDDTKKFFLNEIKKILENTIPWYEQSLKFYRKDLNIINKIIQNNSSDDDNKNVNIIIDDEDLEEMDSVENEEDS